MTETLDFTIFMLTNKRLLFMEYFNRKAWNGGVEMKQSPLLSCRCHGFKLPEGFVGQYFSFFVRVSFKYFNFDTECI